MQGSLAEVFFRVAYLFLHRQSRALWWQTFEGVEERQRQALVQREALLAGGVLVMVVREPSHWGHAWLPAAC